MIVQDKPEQQEFRIETDDVLAVISDNMAEIAKALRNEQPWEGISINSLYFLTNCQMKSSRFWLKLRPLLQTLMESRKS